MSESELTVECRVGKVFFVAHQKIKTKPDIIHQFLMMINENGGQTKRRLPTGCQVNSRM